MDWKKNHWISCQSSELFSNHHHAVTQCTFEKIPNWKMALESTKYWWINSILMNLDSLWQQFWLVDLLFDSCEWFHKSSINPDRFFPRILIIFYTCIDAFRWASKSHIYIFNLARIQTKHTSCVSCAAVCLWHGISKLARLVCQHLLQININE